jgi:uncharacterized protein
MAATPSRTCDVYELARQRQVIDGELPIRDLPRLAAGLAAPTGSLKYRIAGRLDNRGRPGATLSLMGELEVVCQRCGAPLALRLERDAVFRFVASEEELNAVPIDDDEEAEAIVGGHSADLAAWIEDETILSLPLVPRHDDCKPVGVQSSAEPAATVRPSPFAVLSDLKRGSKPH